MSTSLKKENKTPLIVGLTGGIGAGKSTIAKVFQALSVPVFNSDREAKKCISHDVEVVNAIKKEFGNVYQNGELDKVKLAEIVFNDASALAQLNNIVHPKVAILFEEWVAKNSAAKFLIKEAAILIESGAYKNMDKIILVTAPELTRIDRVLRRDTISVEKVKRRIKAQISDDEKLAFADFVIVNDDTKLVIPQVLEIYEEFMHSSKNKKSRK